MGLAMWLQSADAGGNWHLISICIGLITVVLVIMAAVIIGVAIAGLKTVKELGVLAQELKVKCLPMIEEATQISRAGRGVIQDAAPKIKLITENLVKTSETLVETTKVARGTMQHVEATVSDANLRAQRQVARVDGMVTAALTTTAEVVDTVVHGIRVPAQKIAVLVTQARILGEGLLGRAKSMVDGLPFGSRD